MDRNSPTEKGYRLETQIRDAYGKLVYTYTCHNKIAARIAKKNSCLKLSQIIISAIMTGGYLGTIIFDINWLNIVGALFSISLLAINGYMKTNNLADEAYAHAKTADDLWLLKERYVSLLIDFEDLDLEEIKRLRDELSYAVAEVYENSPRTDAAAYEAAQRALKKDEEQFFNDDEVDLMLPKGVRRESRIKNS